jgi:hypothetical protein
LVEALRLGVGVLDLLRQLLRAVEELLPLLTLGLGDRPAEGLLLGPQRLERAQRLPPSLVELDQPLDDGVVLTAGALAGPQPVRVVTKGPQVDHRHEGTRTTLTAAHQ